MAIPTVLIVMVVGLGFSAAAITISANTQDETIRDQDHKDALAIADAGAQRALFTYNKITTNDQQPCVVKARYGSNATLSPGSIPASTDPFCAPIGGPQSGNNADSSGIDPDSRVGIDGGYFTYWVDPCFNQHPCSFAPGQPRTIKIVSQGYQHGVIRRVAITASGTLGQLAQTSAKAIGIDWIKFSGWGDLEVDAATNGTFTMQRSGGCPGTGSDADGQYDDTPLDTHNGCPRICPGDWQAAVNITVGTGQNDLVTPGGNTQGCTLHWTARPKNPQPDPGNPGDPNNYLPRNNPPGPPEVGTLPSPDWQPGDGPKTQANLIHNGNLVLAPVDASSINPNDPNGDLRLGKINQPGGDTSTGPGTITWDQSTRTLTMNGAGSNANGPASTSNALTLTIGGGDYSICKLNMSGYSVLTMAAGAKSRIFIDSPESCGLSGNPVTQLSVTDYSHIDATGYNSFATCPPPGQPCPTLDLLQVAMVGSPTITTQALFQTPVVWPEGAVQQQHVELYAPRTDVVLDTGYSRENEGWFVGKTLTLLHGTEIESNPLLPPVGVGIAPPNFVLFTKQSYVECGPPGNTIDANC